MKKITVIVPSADIGGAQKIGSFVANIASNAGYQVSVVALKRGKNVLELDNKIDLYIMDKKLNGNRIKQIYHRFQVTKRIERKISDINPDLVIVFGTMTETLLALKKKDVPIISTERGFPDQYPEYLKKMMNSLFTKSQMVVFQTPMAQEYYQVSKNKTVVIPNPIFFTQHSTIENKSGSCVTIGRLVAAKGYDYLIEAFSRVHDDFPNEKLEIYGEGEEKENLQSLIDKLDASKYIKLMGKTRNPYEKLCNSKMFILSSIFEGIPNTLLEAMSIGLPIVTTDCLPGGARYLTKNGTVGGPLVDIKSSYKLECALKNQLNNWECAVSMGKEGKYVNEEFSVERIKNDWLNVINSVSKEG